MTSKLVKRVMIACVVAAVFAVAAHAQDGGGSCQDECYAAEEDCYQACESAEDYEACTDHCSATSARCVASCQE